jgi:hypothetical protein
VKVSRRFHDVGTERILPSEAQPMTRPARPILTLAVRRSFFAGEL